MKKKKINRNKQGKQRHHNPVIEGKKHRNKSLSAVVSKVLDLFTYNREQRFDLANVFHRVEASTSSEKALVKRILQSLVEQQRLAFQQGTGYYMPKESQTILATYERDGRIGYAVPVDDGPIVFIPERRSLRARRGDTIEVAILAKRKGELQGEVVAIKEHARENFVGVVKRMEGEDVFVECDDNDLDSDVKVIQNPSKPLKIGDKVLVHIEEWGSNKLISLGKVVEIFGLEGENNTEMHAILAEFGLPYKYPEACQRYAESIPSEIPPSEISLREDFRGVTTFTIDPDDAKDFDDALSIREIDGENFEIGVHIADVSYYVRQGDPVDEEALGRATSVYLVDRTVPMLPERLCNVLCSLRPHEDKLAFSVIFTIVPNTAEILDYRINRTVIQSDRRFTYREAQERIDTGEGDYSREIGFLHTIAQKLRKKRFAHGGIRFQSTELGFVLDENGIPVDVTPVPHGSANELIEEFMLLANRTMAERIGKKKNPNDKDRTFVYRIHENPDPDKIASASQFLAKNKILPVEKRRNDKKELSSEAMNQIFDATAGTPFEQIVSMLFLRAMARARYTTNNIGHYGLAFPYYTHFTSPIRRYPDIMVHRLLASYIFGEGDIPKQEELEETCLHCSDMEQIADQADRASVKYKQAEFLENQRSRVFDGHISGVTEWGLYVMLDHSGCEGLIPIRTLEDDFYLMDEDNYCLVGRRFRKRYTLGQPLRVRVKDVNKVRRLIDFELVE